MFTDPATGNIKHCQVPNILTVSSSFRFGLNRWWLEANSNSSMSLTDDDLKLTVTLACH